MTAIIVRDKQDRIVGIALSYPHIASARRELLPKPFVELAKDAMFEAYLKMVLTDVISEKIGHDPVFL